MDLDQPMTNGARKPRRWAWRGVLLALPLAAACINTFRTGPVPGTDDTQQVEVPMGETRLLDEERLAITFARVLDDSRCPQAVQCVTAGNAVVGLILQERGEATRMVELNTHTGRRTVSHEGYVISVTDLRPLPVAGDSTPAPGTVVRLHVVRG